MWYILKGISKIAVLAFLVLTTTNTTVSNFKSCPYPRIGYTVCLLDRKYLMKKEGKTLHLFIQINENILQLSAVVQSIGNVDDCLGQCLKTETRTKCKYFISRTNWTECLRLLLLGDSGLGWGWGWCVCRGFFYVQVFQLKNIAHCMTVRTRHNPCSSTGKPALKKKSITFLISVTHADLTAGVFGVKRLRELLSRRQWYIVKHSPMSL